MIGALAAADDMVTETIWWFPINNLDGLRRNLEQGGAGRQEREREEAETGGEKTEEEKASMKLVDFSASPSHNQIHWQSVPEAS